MRVRLGSRGSRLALAQARKIGVLLAADGHQPVEVIIETRGDRDQTLAFPEFGGAGVFVREIEQQLIAGMIDVAVHSYKDLPSEGPDALFVAAVPERLDPADVLLIRDDAIETRRGLVPLPKGARVGTSSSRRQALLHAARADLRILPLRGNVDTRVRKLCDGEYDAIVLAHAGLQRLREAGGAPDMDGVQLRRLDPTWFIPAPTQGALALQIRRDATDLADALAPLHDDTAALPLAGERRLLALVEGGCELPFGAWCRAVGEGYQLDFALGDHDQLVTGQVQAASPAAAADLAWQELDGSELTIR